MGFTRQEYWSRKPPPSPGDFPNPGIELGSPAGQVASLPSEPPGKPKMKGTFDGESTQLGAAISFQSASAPHTDHCREISAGEDDDNPGKRAPKPLVHRTELRGSRCPRVVTWRGVTHCPSGLRVTVGCQAAAMAEQPSRGTADPGAFRARASCSPWGKETKLWRVTGSGCSRRHAEHKDWRSPVRGPRKGRGVGVGGHTLVFRTIWLALKTVSPSATKGEEETRHQRLPGARSAGPHGVSFVSMGGKSTHQTPPSWLFLRHHSHRFRLWWLLQRRNTRARAWKRGVPAPHASLKPQVRGWAAAAFMGNHWWVTGYPKCKEREPQSKDSMEPTVRLRPGHDPEAGTRPAIRGVKRYCLRPISRDTPDQRKPKDPIGNKVNQSKSNSTASPNLTRLY